MDQVNSSHEPFSKLRHRGNLSLRGTQFSMALLGWILGQAMIYHRPAPFLWIALLLVWPRWRHLFAPLMAGGIVGTAVGINYWSALLVLGWAFSAPIPFRRSGWEWTRWPLLGIGTASLFSVGHQLNIFDGIIAALVAAGGILLYWAAERQIQVIDTGEGDQGTLITGLAVIGTVIAGLEGWKIGVMAPGLLVGGVLIVVAAILQGPSGGAVAGATLGLTLAFRGTAPGHEIGMLVTGGFLAGLLAVYSWRLASLGLMSGIILYAVLIQMPQELTMFWISLGIASIVIQAIPGSVVELGKLWARLLVQGDTPDTLPSRLRKIAEVMQEMSYAFRIEEEDPPPETNLVEKVVSGVCRKCSLYRTCWEDEFYRSYRSISDLMSTGKFDLMSTGKEELLHLDNLRGGLEKRCIRPDAIIQSANIHLQRERERDRFRMRVKESRALAEQQLKGLSDIIRDMGEDFENHQFREGVKKMPPRLDYTVGVAKRPRSGGLITGDSDLIRELPKNRVIFGLSDGMGVGPRAAWESGTAMALLEQLLDAGFSAKLAIRAVNTTLLLRSVEDHFATLDLLLIDRIGRGAELIKVAAAPTFFCRNGRVEIIRSHSLPVGILQDVSVEPVYHTLNPGDILVMLTDGALESQDDKAEDRLARLLKEMQVMSLDDSQTMAETILSYMLGHDQDGRDDAAVIVIQILEHNHKKRPMSAWERDVRVREWQRVTPGSLRTTS